MAGLADGAAQFAALSRGLKEAGETGLRRELYKAISDAGKPIARKITSRPHLNEYMPDRYAAVLADDLACTVAKLTGRDPGITLRARSQSRKRKVQWLDDGFINHPVYARGDRSEWNWANAQTGGMRPGFFTDPAEDSAPEVRSAILTAMADTARKIAGP
jgi:hypothetical protein